MTRRDAIEKVLNKHLLISSENITILVEELLTCYPEPDREALEKILTSYGCSIKGGGTSAMFFRGELIAWAQGQTEPTWCRCIEWTGNSPRPWRERSSGEDVCGWNFCPTCGTPRPASEGKE